MVVGEIAKAVGLIQKARKFLEPDLVGAAIAATEKRIGAEVVVDDALQRWERSPGFDRLLGQVRSGVAFLSFETFVHSFVDDGEFFGTAEEAAHVVGTFIECLDAELQKRAPLELILARQLQSAEDLRRDLGMPPRRELPPFHGAAAMREEARKTRAMLRPWILPSVARRGVLELLMNIARQSLRGESKHIAGIVAPAGHGKTTALAQLFDALTNDDFFAATPIAFVRADLLIFDDVKREAELDQRVCEAAHCDSLRDLAAGGDGAILLLDTLDLMLTGRTEKLAPALLRRYAEAGVTIIFTCRDFEFARSLEPVETQFAGSPFARMELPLFTREEVREAARAFLVAANTATEEDAAVFAERVVALSADRRSLDQIVRSPLLLAMLCDVFGRTGSVPEDLTTSVLYAKYWDVKVGSSRNRDMPDRIAHTKREVCARIGERLFSASESHLQLSVVDADLASLSELAGDAIAELQSEGVLVRGRRGELSFFHQTLAEFAIAKWLTSEAARASRGKLLERLRTEAGSRELHWWPVVRQLTAVASTNAGARAVVDALDLANPYAYRAAILGSASRDDDGLTARLAGEAIGDGEKERIALEALASVPSASWPMVVDVAIEFIRKGGNAAVKSAVHDQLVRLLRLLTETERGEVAVRTLEALQERKRNSSLPRDTFDSSGSRLLHALLRCGRAPEVLLQYTRSHFRDLGPSAQGAAIELHLRSDAAPWAFRELHDIVAAKSPGVGSTAPSISLLVRLLELGEPYAPWPDFLAMLHASYRPKWQPVQAKAAARFALRDGATLRALVDSFVEGTHVEPDLIALQEAIEADAEAVLDPICGRPLASYPVERLKPLTRLVSDARHSVSPGRAQQVIEWILEGGEAATAMLSSLVAMAGLCTDQWDRVLRVYLALSAEERTRASGSISLLSGAAVDSSFIAAVYEDVASRGDHRARIDLAARGLHVAPERYLPILIETSLSKSEHLASAAGNAIELVKDSLCDVDPRTFEPMLGSRYGAVRANALEVLRLQGQVGALRVEDAARIVARVSHEKANNHRTLLLNIFSTVLYRSKDAIPDVALDAHLRHVVPLLLVPDIDGGVAREAMNGHATLVRRGSEAQLTRLAEPTLRLFREFDLDRTAAAGTPFRAMLHTFDERMPGTLETYAAVALDAPEGNQEALALVIFRRRGMGSALLERLLRDAPDRVQVAVRKRLGRD